MDKLVETKGLDYVDREKAKRHAKKQAEQIYEQQYGNRDLNGSGGGNWGNVAQRYGVGAGMGGHMGQQGQLLKIASILFIQLFPGVQHSCQMLCPLDIARNCATPCALHCKSVIQHTVCLLKM